MKLASFLTLLVVLVGTTAWYARPERPDRPNEAAVADRPREILEGDYVSSDACRACHPWQHATWSDSYHRRMTQRVTPETVLAPFDVSVTAFGRTIHLLREGDRFFAEMDDPLWMDRRMPAPRVKRPLVLATGSHHEQDFWFPDETGRALALLPIVYRIAEKRWVPYGSTLLTPPRPPDEPLTQELGAWNRNCLQCHSTFPRPHLDWNTAVDTQVAEFGIACEACHGPGAKHVQRYSKPWRRYVEHLSEKRDPSIVNPARLSGPRSSEVCGQCHMVTTVLGPATHPEWNESGPAYRPGDDLEATRDVVSFDILERPIMQRILQMEPDFMRQHFWPDGMIRVAGREYHGVRDSPCFAGRKYSCLSCHTMHSDPSDQRPALEWANDQLVGAMQGDDACLQCHRQFRGAVEAHTHHAESSEGSRCYNCHMPYTSYGLLKATRSHEVDVPDIPVTEATGRPNACTACHVDRSLGWAADQLQVWYGRARPPLDDERNHLSAAVLDLLRGDAGQRALAAWHLGWPAARKASASEAVASWSVPLLAQLLVDPYDAVRFIAADSLRQALEEAGIEYDFVGNESDRIAARDRLIHWWSQSRVGTMPSDPTTVALRTDGSIDQERITALLGRRDDRPIFLNE